MTNQLETAKQWLSDLNKIIDKTDNECTKEKRDVLEWLVESVEWSEDDLQVNEMHYDKSGLNLKLGGQTAKLFLSTLVDLFEINGGKNFLTMTVHQNEIKYAITIQNQNGIDTPSEKLERLEKQNQIYKQALELVEDELEYAKTTGNDEVRDMYIKNSIRFINEALEREG